MEDPTLTWKGTSILSFLLSKSDNWQTNPKHLAKVKKDGIKSVYSGLKELKEAGYIEHRLIRDEKGKIIRGEYIIYEEPWLNPKRTLHQRTSSPETHFGNAASDNAEKLPLPNTDCLINTDYDQRQQAGSSDKPPEKIQSSKPSEKSLSFSFGDDNGSFCKQSEKLDFSVEKLMDVIPEQHRINGVKSCLFKGLQEGRSEEYIRGAIAYTTKHSKKSFGAYLANCIDQNWHDIITPNFWTGT